MMVSAAISLAPSTRHMPIIDQPLRGQLLWVVDDASTMPLLHPGDIAVVETCDRLWSIAEGPDTNQIYLLQYENILGPSRRDGEQPIRRSWMLRQIICEEIAFDCRRPDELTLAWHVRPYARSRSRQKPIALRDRIDCHDGPYTDGTHVQNLIVGRVVGIFQPLLNGAH